ncbi:chromate transporter [Candidatus Gastranaerophilales bacterium]|nr:MAG: chromate transporter [Candidatus Gastranaerophilales bacterium]
MIYLQLFLEFFHIGLFSFGGGYATLPFLYHIAEDQGWYTTKQLTDMIAVSSITPGPVGVNVATFAGYTTSGILGALVATSSVILPSLIIVIIISKLLEQFKHNKYVKSVIYSIKPAGCGLLGAVAVDMFLTDLSVKGVVLLLILFGFSLSKKHDPLFYLGLSSIAGLLISLIKF